MPPVTGALLGANILLFFVGFTIPLGEFALWPPVTGPQAGPGFELWQLVTYSFLHGNLLHLGYQTELASGSTGIVADPWGTRLRLTPVA